MTDTDDDTLPMPASFRAALDAALSRPMLLDPRALDPLRISAGGLRPRAARKSRAAAAEDDEEVPVEDFTREGDVAVVSVEGPLSQRAWACWMFRGDGYDAVQRRVGAALADASTRAVVLRIDSPGGEVAGCFDAVRTIRAQARESGKPLVAYADELACSAAYALACAADEVIAPDTGILGSIGVIMTVASHAGALAQRGIAVNIITSGAAKADGHPAQTLSSEARERLQADVNALARLFAAEVSHARPLTAEQVLALEARTALGGDAVRLGLADRTGTLSTAIARARELAATRTTRNTMPDPAARATLDQLRASLSVETDAELTAAAATLKKRAEAADAAFAEVARLKGELAARDARAEAAARDAVLAKHRQRGALTPAMEADAEYMADLAPLAPLALDRILSRLQGAAPAAVPRKVESVDPAAPADAPAAATRADREWQKVTGVSDAGLKLAIEDEDRRRRARAEDDAA